MASALPPAPQDQPLMTSIGLGDALQLRRRGYMKALMLERAADAVLMDFGGDPSRGPPKLLVDLGVDLGLAAVPPVEVHDLVVRLKSMADDERRRARSILRTGRIDVKIADLIEPVEVGPLVGNVENHQPVQNPQWTEERAARWRADGNKLSKK